VCFEPFVGNLGICSGGVWGSVIGGCMIKFVVVHQFEEYQKNVAELKQTKYKYSIMVEQLKTQVSIQQQQIVNQQSMIQ
jgi:hypothetical protein